MNRFGPQLKDKWGLDPSVTYLNHGTVGATPLSILRRQAEIGLEIERQPARFLFRELVETTPPQLGGAVPHLRAAADRVGAFLGAQGQDIVFVDNATTAINAVLRSFPFETDDTLVLTNYGYGSFPPLAEAVAKQNRLRLETIELPFPVSDPNEILEAFSQNLPDPTRLVLVDHIASLTGVLLPIHGIAEICRERGATLLVDGAHVPGNIDLNIAEIGAHIYVGNLHKWMWAPRSSAIIWAEKEMQAAVRPLLVSWEHGNGFTREFDLAGTTDPTAHLTAPDAIDLLVETGFGDIVEHNHQLATNAATLLADAWGTNVLSSPECMTTMAAVELPKELGITSESALEFRNHLLDHHQIEVQVSASGDITWVRVGVQIYNDLDDVKRLAEVVANLQ